MHLVKRINKKYLLLALFIILFFSTRLPRLHNDNVNPDSHNWHVRSEQFMNGLKYAQFEKTYQHYQPGVTLMWIIGPTVEIVKQFGQERLVYDQVTFPVFHYYSKLVLVFVQLVLSLIILYLLCKFMDFWKALLTVSLFTFEVFFLANSRMLHMDVLLALLLFIGLLFSYWNIKEFSWKKGALSGFFLGMAFLTKSVAIGGILFSVVVGSILVCRESGSKKGWRYAFSILVPSIATIFVFLPALWVNAKEVLFMIYDGIERVGMRRGHGHIFFGKETRDPGVFFYPLIIFLKTTPLLLLGLLLNLIEPGKLNVKKISLRVYLGIFFIGYLVVMTIGSKKLDRYMLPVFPYLALLSVYGYSKIQKKFSLLQKAILSCVVVSVFIVFPMFNLFPYYFTYTNPFFGSPKFVHENIVAQKPFGVGVFELKDALLGMRRYYPRIALLDIKPMLFMYKGGYVMRTSVAGTRSYNINIVAVNEDVSEKVKNSDYEFNHAKSIFINGLEYWKLYVRGDKKR